MSVAIISLEDVFFFSLASWIKNYQDSPLTFRSFIYLSTEFDNAQIMLSEFLFYFLVVLNYYQNKTKIISEKNLSEMLTLITLDKTNFL